jgi:hypothetical protein
MLPNPANSITTTAKILGVSDEQAVFVGAVLSNACAGVRGPGYGRGKLSRRWEPARSASSRRPAPGPPGPRRWCWPTPTHAV